MMLLHEAELLLTTKKKIPEPLLEDPIPNLGPDRKARWYDLEHLRV